MNINYAANTFLELFGYETTEDFAEHSTPEQQALLIVFHQFQKLPPESTVFVVALIAAITGIKIESSIDFLKYLARLDSETIKEIATLLQTCEVSVKGKDA